MSFLPPDPPLETAPRAPKASADSVLAAPRLPVTRWNRRYLIAGAAVLAAVVATAFWIGFGGAGKAPAKKADAPARADVGPTTPAFADRYAKGYGDPAVQAIGAPGTVSLPPAGTQPSAQVAGAAAQPRQVDPAVQLAQQQAQAARSASPFFGGAVTGSPAASAAQPVSTYPVGYAPAAGPGPAPASTAEKPAADVQPANGQTGKHRGHGRRGSHGRLWPSRPR